MNNLTDMYSRPPDSDLHDVVADELARLRAENERYREALEQFAEADLNDGNCASFEVANRRIRRLARAALHPTDAEGQSHE